MSKPPYWLDDHGADQTAAAAGGRPLILPRAIAVGFAVLSLLTGLANLALWFGVYTYQGAITASVARVLFIVLDSSLVGLLIGVIARSCERKVRWATVGIALNLPSAVVAIGAIL